MSSYTYDLTATDDRLKAIGMVAAEYSYLESIVETAIWALAEIQDDDIGRAITTHVRMGDRLNVLLTLFRLRRPADVNGADDLKKLRNRIMGDGGVAPQRNDLVHGLWGSGEHGSPQIATVKTRGTLVKTKRGKKAREIEAVAASIAAVSPGSSRVPSRQGRRVARSISTSGVGWNRRQYPNAPCPLRMPQARRGGRPSSPTAGDRRPRLC
jgi:hypothetical protein